MTVSNFIPTLWSARLLANLDKNHVYGAIVNRDFEGEIKAMGDTVKINQMGEITIGDYAKADIGKAEELTSDQKTLKVDQAKYFNFQVDSVDQAQSNVKLMDGAMQRAGVAMADVVDQSIAKAYLEAGSAIGDDTTPVELTATNVYDQLVDLATLLDEGNAPEDGRFVVIPAFVHGLLLKAPEFVKGSDLGDSVVTKGFVGEVAGMKVYKSNNVPNVAGEKFKIMAGHTSAIAFAEQVVDVRAYQPEQRFSDAVKGLHVFGSKVVLPNALAVLTANRG